MPQPMSSHSRRQVVNTDPDYCYGWWSCDQTGFIVRWVIIAVIVFFFFAFILGGYWHARRRMAKGLPPLRYHRWLVSRRDRERYSPQQPQNSYGFYRPAYGPGAHGQPQMYPMQNYGYAPPPPAYHEAESAPVYSPPTKVNPDQSYAPPTGSPPAGYGAAAGSSSLNAPAPSQPLRTTGPPHNDNNK